MDEIEQLILASDQFEEVEVGAMFYTMAAFMILQEKYPEIVQEIGNDLEEKAEVLRASLSGNVH